MNTSSFARISTALFLAVLLEFNCPVRAQIELHGTWEMTGSMSTARRSHTATLLPDGTVLVAGGNVAWEATAITATAEVYDPVTATWRPTRNMNQARTGHAAILLPNGRVLVAGGMDSNWDPIAGAELYDPATGEWTPTGAMWTARHSFGCVLLMNGDVLVAGGWPHITDYGIGEAEVYNPASGTWRPVGNLNTARAGASLTLLPDGRALAAGGAECCGYVFFDSAELYDPESESWTPTASMLGGPRHIPPTAVLLRDGNVLIAGSHDFGGASTVAAELYNPPSETWTATGPLIEARSACPIVVLPDGLAMMIGGIQYWPEVFLDTVELYDPDTGTWTATASLAVPRASAGVVVLQTGRVLATGGLSFGNEALTSAELYTPTALNLEEAPVITLQPSSLSLYVGDTGSLTVRAYGTRPLFYQWRKNGADLAGATNATLVLSNVTEAATGDYAARVTNAYGMTDSATAHVSVTARPWPYVEDFEGVVGAEWSRRKTDTTPVDQRRFLGQFGNETVTLAFNALPPHREVTIAFDLFMINTWDGSSPTGTLDTPADLWEFWVGGDRLMLRASFRNHASEVQSFPDEYPGNRCHPPRTGAVENDTLGFDLDAVYRLAFTVTHTSDSLALTFLGKGLEDLWNESWGLDNVTVTLLLVPGESYVAGELAPVSEWRPESGASVYRVSTSGTHALAASFDGRIHLLDVSNPSAPALSSAWTSLFPASDAVLTGNRAYVASYEPDFLSTVEIVDVSDSAHPVLRGYYDTAGHAEEIAVEGSTLYVADGEGGLVIVDASDPSRPREIGCYETPGYLGRVRVLGDRAYIVDGNWLVILDVSDPAHPVRLGFSHIAGGIEALEVVGHKAYVCEGSVGLCVYDVSDPGHVTLLGTYRAGSMGLGALAVAGRHAHLGRSGGWLTSFDVSDSANVVWAGSASVGAAVEDVAAVDDMVYAACGTAGLRIFEWRETIWPPLAPPLVSDGMLTFSWPLIEGVRLQRTATVAPPGWQDVPGSDVTNTVRVPATETMAFFRLAK